MKPKLLFVYDLENEELWKDGLWAAIELLKEDFELKKYNLRQSIPRPEVEVADFILGWGGFGSNVDNALRETKRVLNKTAKYGLCLGGYAPATDPDAYDIIFVENDWAKYFLKSFSPKCKIEHAFGVNKNIYKPDMAMTLYPKALTYKGEKSIEPFKIWDYLTVGAFALWKRQIMILNKKGTKLAVGQIQKGNMQESIDIVGNLLLGGCAISDSVDPETLAKIYNASKTVYIPADAAGGGERAVLEARACGVPVEIEEDNAKLKELLTCPIWDHKYYAKQLKKGIEACLNQSS